MGGASKRSDDTMGIHSPIRADPREHASSRRAHRMSGPRILLVIGGGIAAYKACELVRLIRKAGGEVTCVLTEGGQQFVQGALEATGFGPWGIHIIMQIVLVVLGMFLDWVGILLLCVPIFVPIIKALGAASFGFDNPDDLVLWFGVLYLVNMQMSFLSPPFGYALFYLRGVAPAEIPMTDIFKSALPFLFLQIVGLLLCMFFPEIITWLPNIVYG